MSAMTFVWLLMIPLLCTAAFAYGDGAADAPPPAALLQQGDALFQQRKYAEAQTLYQQAVEAARAAKNSEVLAESLAQAARCCLIQEQKEAGRPWLEQARAAAGEDRPLGWSRYLGVRGRFEWKDGKLAEATATFTAMYDYCRAHKLHDRAVDAAHMVALTAPPDQQIVWAHKGIEAATEAGQDGWLGPLWNNLGATLEDLGKFPESLAAYEQARHYHWKVGDEQAKLIADWAVGHAHRLNGNLDRATQWLRPVLAWAERRHAESPDPERGEWIGLSCRELGEIAVARQRPADALPLIERAEEFLRAAKMPEWDAAGFGKITARLAELKQAAGIGSEGQK